MTVRKLTPKEKISLFLIINSLFFGGIFGLGLIWLPLNWIEVILVAAASIEVIYLTVFTKMSINKNAQMLTELEKRIEGIREDEEKTRTVLIYIGHQMKAIQHELDGLRKNSTLRTNGNGQHPKMHI